jgi:hypothetical protein
LEYLLTYVYDRRILSLEETKMTAKKTLYVRPEAEPVWKEAEKLTGDSLSSLVEKLLGQYVYRQRALEALPTDTIVVDVTDDDGNTIKKRFRGKWILRDYQDVFSVALTERGNLALITEKPNGEADLDVFEDIEDMAMGLSDDCQELVAVVAGILGKEYVVDLDI